MGWFIFLGILVIIGVIGYFVIQQKKKWQKIYEDTGLTDEAADQYAFLQRDNVRCRLQQIPIGTGPAPADTAMNATGGADKFKVRLEVHKDDFEKAQKILETYIPKRRSIL